jgi:hypothetical protein
MTHTDLHNALSEVITGIKSKKLKPQEAAAICKAANEITKLHDKEMSVMKALGVSVDLPLFGLSKTKVTLQKSTKK